ncbi:hypothetical protein AMJ96_CH00608 [Rhizobium sp. N113]|uniref:hypothetical protein n=1 Tax=Rhizobium TaxID=379 RepID=UPI0007EB98D0|nr:MULTISPECIES: hypothetical protein [Rhizobium]ANL02199.1 hypothetical protein AMJ99_CH00604 [Rhizobium esperanzae]ANL08327.1 hypothetical protein AMJ98_CH00604 [Rhizobium sp. N1341]ANL20376.1 hypothetical protein AMJ96_CH00608 [Rhizobium sp. N113]ANM33050.1 hypothetical protein AMK04_CH00604 [Rhizobium sp. N871]ANM39168.1 hypothetical protein AMK03_CH00604 [Rhizobium sp. N741]
MDAKDDTVTKGEFAALIGVSAGRVSQYLKEGRISAAAIEGAGRNARIRVNRAKADLSATLDVGQRFGNGLATRLEPTAQPSWVAPREADVPVGIDREIKEQKLEQIRRSNRKAAIDEALTRGILMRTDDARAEMSKITAQVIQDIEGKLPEASAAIAAEFKLPQRDVLHLMRKTFLQLRGRLSAAYSSAARDLPEAVETLIDFEESHGERLLTELSRAQS